MKKFNFNPNALKSGVALALGLTAGSVSAATVSLPNNTVQINNIASATYNVDGQAQPPVSSNAVIVNVNEVGSFSLISTIVDGNPNSDDAVNQPAIPGGNTTFTHKLENTGNVKDTYTLTLSNDGGTSSIITEADNYQFSSLSNMNVEIFKDGGTASIRTISGLASGGKVDLLPDEYAIITYSATTPLNGVIGGNKDTAVLTATGTYVASSLVNEDQARVVVPTFAITKSAGTTSTIDMSKTTQDVIYKITVKNDGSLAYASDAKGVLIQDVLPKGVTLKSGSTVTVRTDNAVSTKEGTVNTSLTDGSGRQIIAVQDVDLLKNETITIEFTATVNTTQIDPTRNLINDATVYDNYTDTSPTAGNTPNSDITDSTATIDPTSAKVPTDSNDNGSSLSLSRRALTVSTDTDKELPPISASNAPATYTHVITNSGNVTETGMTFKIIDSTTGNNIDVRNVTYNGTVLSPNSDGVYTIPTSLAPTATGTITYDVTTGVIASNTGATGRETTQLILTAGDISGTTPPPVDPVSDKTTVKALTLDKLQALDATCDGSADTGYSKADINNAIPGQCVMYQITATNTFTTKAMTNIVISDAASDSANPANDADLWGSKATYIANSATATGSASGSITSLPTVGATSTTGKVQATFPTMTAGQTGVLTFRVKINKAN